MSNTRLYNGDRFEHKGYTFEVEYQRDDCMSEPWKEHDGHGVVSEWTSREKKPGERVLVQDSHGRAKRYYDVKASIAIARKDQWGPVHCALCDSSEHGPYSQEYGPHANDHNFKPESPGQTAARAVEKDYEYLRAWCNDEWEWTYAVVTLIEDGEKNPDASESIGGIDGDHDGGKYLTEVAYELADEIVSRLEVANPDIQRSEN